VPKAVTFLLIDMTEGEGKLGFLTNNSRPIDQSGEAQSQCRSIRWFFRILAVCLALARIVAARNTIGPDPRSYMELARAILRHDWPMITTGHWSALYPWLLAPLLGVVKPSLRWEFPVAHALAFPIYLVCIAAFEFFWTTLLRCRTLISDQAGVTHSPIPVLQMWVLGYSLFTWTTVGGMILLINPDMCVTAIVLLAAALLLRMEIFPNAGWPLYVGFGICLGFGYLAKAFLFPMAFVFLGMMIVVSRRALRRKAFCFALAALSFTALATPQVVALSRSKGRLTFSDSGKLAIAWLTYGLPYRDWQGEPPGSGTPVHPTRKIYDHPAVYEFNGPLRSSYPPWYDPSYWDDGMSPAFRFDTVARHVIRQVLELGLNLLQPTAWFAGMLLTLLFADPRSTLKGMAPYWILVVISATAFSLFCLTLVEGRYLYPWEILIWGSVLAAVRLRRVTLPMYRYLAAAVSLALIAAMLNLTYRGFSSHFPSDASPEYATAEGLLRMGVQPGTKVGAIGFDNDAYWAYLARFDIVAEINTEDTCLFWSEPPEIQSQVLEKFAEAGASVVVANTGGGVKTTSRAVPFDLAGCARPGPQWKNIEGSPNHAFFPQ